MQLASSMPWLSVFTDIEGISDDQSVDNLSVFDEKKQNGGEERRDANTEELGRESWRALASIRRLSNLTEIEKRILSAESVKVNSLLRTHMTLFLSTSTFIK